MTTNFFPTSSTGTSNRVSMGAGDYTDIMPGVTIISTDGHDAINDSSYGTVQVDGYLNGAKAIDMAGTSGTTSFVNIGTDGILAGYGSNSPTLYVGAGNSSIVNRGQITSLNSAGMQLLGPSQINNYGSITSNSNTAISFEGGAIINHGSIDGATGITDLDPNRRDNSYIYNYGTLNGNSLYCVYYGGNDSVTLFNYGTITSQKGVAISQVSTGARFYVENHGIFDGNIQSGNADVDTVINYATLNGSVSMGTGDGDKVKNYGTIEGSVYLAGSDVLVVNKGTITGSLYLSGAGSVDSSQGIIGGQISCGPGGYTVIGGTQQCQIDGGNGNDILYADPTKAAADAETQTTIDGGSGINALYGDGAYTTFYAGDTGGGRNKIRGGLSMMADVAGYANNTVNFELAPSSVYVDLLNGHNAYLYAGANHSGALTFEDSIQNVPNVIGSSGGDVIRADNGTDTIQGGPGGDILYAGAGLDTFVYSGYADSNTATGYDTISGFVTGKDKLDLSALNSDASHLAIASGANATILYLEATPGKFTASTDLAISFAGAKAIAAADVIF